MKWKICSGTVLRKLNKNPLQSGINREVSGTLEGRQFSRYGH